MMHRPRWTAKPYTAALFAPLALVLAWSQEVGPPLPHPPDSQPTAAASANPGKAKYGHTNDFVIRGTVFNDKALSFPGVELRIRRAGENKFRWQSYTNSRGEFAVRVRQGSNYEMVLHVKGYADQARTIDAKKGGDEGSMVFRMEPAEGKKK